jgi:hypothetical protein
MQREKINRPFLKYWKFSIYRLIKKIMESQNKVMRRLLFLFKVNISNAFVLREIIPYVFSGFSIIFIGYVIMNILTNYPTREIGISP